MEKTLGEIRVRIDFNPSNNSVVDKIKQDSATLINTVESLRGDGSELISGEKARLISVAQTKIEEAAMWAVKAATA